jgi:tetratricopeptide (TPR) repeat protein
MEPARQAYTESLAIRRALGDLKGVADTLFELCTVFWGQGQLEQAEHLARESIAIQSDTGDPVGLAGGLCNLGFVFMLRGQFCAAQDAFEEAGAVANDLGAIVPYYAYYTIMQGRVQMHLGRYDEALAQAHLTTNLLPEEIWWVFADAQAMLGELALIEESYAEAQRLLQGSAAAFQERQPYSLGLYLAILAYSDRGLGQLSQARQRLTAALATVTEMRHFWAGLLALPAAALVLADEGRAERAVEIYAVASHYPFVANSRWFEDVAGKHIAAIAATLPPEMVATAQERGRARDLWATAAELLGELEGA